MSRFFVGQRVKLAWRRSGATSDVPVGHAGTIVRIGPWAPGALSKLGGDVIVQWDGLEQAMAAYSQLEPILPEGHKPSEFSYEELLENLKTLQLENVA